MRRRDFIAGSAALAAYAQVREAEALVGSRRVLFGGLNAASFANGLAPPPGYHWDFVTSNGQRVTSKGAPVVSPVPN